MSAKTKRALRKKRYLDNKDASQLYIKEYRESNRNAIRESQKQYYEQNKDAIKLSAQQCGSSGYSREANRTLD